MRCSKHPDVDTNLTCGKCGTPICPKCLIQTPVGSRCQKCAGIKQLPTYNITLLQHLKALGVGLVVAVVMGIVWTILRDIIPFFSLFLAAGMGYAMGELISRSVNRKRGRGLQLIGGFCIAFSYMIVIYSDGSILLIWDLLALALAIFFTIRSLR